MANFKEKVFIAIYFEFISHILSHIVGKTSNIPVLIMYH